PRPRPPGGRGPGLRGHPRRAGGGRAGHRGRLLLLSDEEPGGVRRRRPRDDARRRPRRAAPAPPQPRPSPEVRPRRARVNVRPRRATGRHPARQAPSPRGVDGGAPPHRPPLRGGARGAAPRAPVGADGGSPRHPPVHGPHPPPRRPRQAPRRRRHRHGVPLPAADSRPAALPEPRLRRGGVPDRLGGRPDGPVTPLLSRADRSGGRRRRRLDSSLLRGRPRMRVLITGLTGFVGSHLADCLLARGDVELFGTHRWRSRMDNVEHLRGRVTLAECDLRDAAATRRMLATVSPDRTSHLAPQSYAPTSWLMPAETLLPNIQLQLNIFEAVSELCLES